MDRREMIGVAIGSLIVGLPETTVVLPTKQIFLDTPSDDRRAITHTKVVVERDIKNLDLCEVRNGWGGEKIGDVLRWYVEDGWLMADVRIPQLVARDIVDKKSVIAPSFFADCDKDIWIGEKGGNITKMKSADECALHPFADGLWRDKR